MSLRTMTAGDALRAYLAPDGDTADWPRGAAPLLGGGPAYPDAERTPLPWARPTPAQAAADDVLAIGELTRRLLGIARLIWLHPADDALHRLDGPPFPLAGRSAPSGGALYPIEAYLAVGGALPAALHHYDPWHHALATVRAGDHRGALVDAVGRPPARPPWAVVVLAAVFGRATAKYRGFGYRLVCQEAGVLFAQLDAATADLGVTACAHLDVDDAAVEELLGLDPEHQGAMLVVTLDRPGAVPQPQPQPPGPDAASTARRGDEPPPGMPVDSPAGRLHRAGRTPPRPRTGDVPAPAPSPGPLTLPPPAPVRLANGQQRRSSPVTGYRREPIAAVAVSTVIEAASGPWPGDVPGPVTELYLLARAVDGVAPGVYRCDPASGTLATVGDFGAVESLATAPAVRANTRLALWSAAAVLVPVGDPLAGVEVWGDRWYRVQQFEVGLRLHRAILAATTLGLAARIHSDGAFTGTDDALGLAGTSRRSLSFLLLGVRGPTGPLLDRWFTTPPPA